MKWDSVPFENDDSSAVCYDPYFTDILLQTLILWSLIVHGEDVCESGEFFVLFLFLITTFTAFPSFPRTEKWPWCLMHLRACTVLLKKVCV